MIQDYITPPNLLEELQANATGPYTKQTTDKHYLLRTDKIGDMGAYIIEKYQPNLMTIHFSVTDFWQHQEGRKGSMVTKSIAATDRAIGKLVEAVQKGAIIG